MSTPSTRTKSSSYALCLAFALYALTPNAVALTASDIFTPETIFPLFGNHPLIRDHAESLPAPYGISANYLSQKQYVAIENLQFDQFVIEPLGPLTLPASVSDLLLANFKPAHRGENRLQQYGLRFDVWLLPILNLFYMPSRGHGRTVVDGLLAGADLSNFIRLNYDVDSETRGVTVAGGYGRWWGSVTGARTQSEGTAPEQLQFSLRSDLLSPRIGFKASPRWNVWIGAAHLKLHRLNGQIRGLSWTTTVQALPTTTVGTLLNVLNREPNAALENLNINFSADVEPPHHWSWFGGIAYQLSPLWTLQTELGSDALNSWQAFTEIQMRLP